MALRIGKGKKESFFTTGSIVCKKCVDEKGQPDRSLITIAWTETHEILIWCDEHGRVLLSHPQSRTI